MRGHAVTRLPSGNAILDHADIGYPRELSTLADTDNEMKYGPSNVCHVPGASGSGIVVTTGA